MDMGAMEKTAELFKIFSDKNRIRILTLLERRKMCVCELAYILNVTQPSVSRHLRKMKQAGLIKDEKDRFWTNYFLAKDSVCGRALMKCLKNWLAGEETLRSDLKKLNSVDRTKLCCK